MSEICTVASIGRLTVAASGLLVITSAGTGVESSTAGSLLTAQRGVVVKATLVILGVKSGTGGGVVKVVLVIEGHDDKVDWWMC